MDAGVEHIKNPAKARRVSIKGAVQGDSTYRLE